MDLDFSVINNISPRTPKNGAVTHGGARGIVTPPRAVKAHSEPVRSCAGYPTLREQQRLYESAVKVLKNEQINRKAAEGCRRQILLDLENGKDPREILLFAAEAIGRLSGCGDSFFEEVREKLQGRRAKQHGRVHQLR